MDLERAWAVAEVSLVEKRGADMIMVMWRKEAGTASGRCAADHTRKETRHYLPLNAHQADFRPGHHLLQF